MAGRRHREAQAMKALISARREAVLPALKP